MSSREELTLTWMSAHSAPVKAGVNVFKG